MVGHGGVARPHLNWGTIDNKGLVKHNPYHIGQFALAVAIIKMNIPYEIIERSWIYQYFFINHFVSEIKDNQEITHLIMSLSEEYPEIIELLKKNADYQFLLNNTRYMNSV